MKTVYFVRHGESEANVAGLTAGAELDTPLTEDGRAQARLAGQELQGKSIDLIVCSPLQRAHDTARLIAEAVGYDPSKILTNEAFIERRVGKFSGRPHQEYVQAVRSKAPVDGLETSEGMHKRVSKGLEWLKQQDAEHIVVVSHGGTGRIIRIINQGLHHSDLHKVDGFGNTEIYEFTLD